MVRGFTFETDATLDIAIIVRAMTNSINIDDYIWVVDDISPFYDGNLNETCIGIDIMKKLEADVYYFFALIRQYPKNAQIEDGEFYKDFLESECLSLLICSHGYIFEFYAKDSKMIAQAKKDLMELSLVVEDTTDENDGRRSLHIF
jgi:hypothetical protein